MPISKRTLTKWRKEGLQSEESLKRYDQHVPVAYAKIVNSRILLLTQELLDQCLLKEK